MRTETTTRGTSIVEEIGSGNSVELRLVFPSTQSSVRAALASTMSGLGAMNLSDDESSTIELVLAEVLNNVTEHAYRDEGFGLIEMHLKQSNDGLSCRIIDTGDAMPRKALPPGFPPNPNRPVDHQPEGGFGWFLIRKLTTELTYMRESNCNVLKFNIELGRGVRQN